MSEYSNSMPFNKDLDTDNPKFTALFTKVETEVKPLIPEKKYLRNRYPEHLKLILLNLLRAHRQNKQRYVGYYNKRTHYYPQTVGAQGLKISYEPFRCIVQALETLEFITTKRGFSYEGGRSRSARMRATEKLKELFRPARSTFPDENLIVLKNTEGKYLPYTESPDIKRMRDNLTQINDQLNKHFIGLYIPDNQLTILNNQLKKRKRPRCDQSKTLLRRTFSHGSFDLGGRFHSGFWIQLPKDYRSFVRIDHEETGSMDFSATVLNLIYLVMGHEVPNGDAYELPGTDPRDRELLKVAAQIIVNTESRKAAVKAIHFDILCRRVTHGSYEAEDIVAAFEEKHGEIKDMFYRELGVAFQRRESDIAEAIMLRFIKDGKPILPVHDAFVVKKKDIALLEQAMTEEVVAIYGRPLPFKVEGPSKLSFLAAGDEKKAYSEYYEMWRERRLDQDQDRQDQLESEGSPLVHEEAVGLLLVA